MSYEYTVLPAPLRAEKAPGAKTPTDRYALAVAAELNRMAREGWEYVRADVLPSEERSGLTGRTTIYHNLLVFRRPLAARDAPEAARPMPEYPVAASPAQRPQPTPPLPEAAAPLPAASAPPPAAAVPETPVDAVPPAPRTPPER